MFKALVAASLAMLLCCAAAALAGPVPPVIETDTSGDRWSAIAGEPSPLHMMAEPYTEPSPAPSQAYATVDGFVSSVSLSATYEGGAPLAPEDMTLIPPVTEPAVIPLPVPLYAGTLLLALILIARRAILRAC